MVKPFLSICIPTYNRAEIVFECVQNCLQLPYSWIEVVVTDNCSTDNTKDIFSSINDSRFHYYRNEKNIGYINLAMSLKNGSGQFCLLLSDEDDFINTDWEKLKCELQKRNECAVFQFRYLDHDGTELLSGPAEQMKAGSYQALKYIYNHFAYAGGTIIRNSVYQECWREHTEVPVLWSLYSEIILPLDCGVKGDLAPMQCITVARGERNNRGTLDVKAWCGETEEPYWNIRSRRIQLIEWLIFIQSLNVPKEIKIKLSEEIVCDAIVSYRRYYRIVVSDSNDELFKRYHQLIQLDKKRYSYRWIRSTYQLYGEIAKKYDTLLGQENRDKVRERQLLRWVKLYFIRQYIERLFKRGRI